MDYNEKYIEEERKRVKRLYNRSKHKGFSSGDDLADWYVEQLRKYKCRCYFCEVSIHDINRLIDSGRLKTRKTGYGLRGPVLEIDKNDDTYTRELCVLACYYCNNDKSYTTTAEDYKKYFGHNRKKYFDLLLNVQQ